MSDRKLAILGLAAAVMVLLTVVVGRVFDRPVRESKLDVPLIQGLDVSKVAVIELGSGDKAVRLKREGNGFILANKDNYPALMSKINNLVASCLDIVVGEAVTENPENHAALEVTEDKALNVVKFLDGQDKLITGLVIGKRDSQAGGSYVRMLSEDASVSNKVYVAAKASWIQMADLSYTEKKFIDVKKEEITRVVVTNSEGSYTIAGDNGKASLQGIGEGKQAKGEDYDQVFSAMVGLEFEDVQKEGKGEALKFDSSYVCYLKDSTICTFLLAKKDDKVYAKCSAEFGDKTEVTMQKGVVESEEQLKEKEAKLLARDAAKEFSKRHEGWVYTLSSWPGNNMLKKFSDLVEAKPAEAKPAEVPVEAKPAEAKPAEVPAETKPAETAPAETK